MSGTLLGAIRGNSFAGRPSDVDIAIRNQDCKKILDSFPTLIKTGVTSIKIRPKRKIKRIQLVLKSVLIDIEIFTIKKIKNKKYWVGDPLEKKKPTIFNLNDLKKFKSVYLYNKKFYSPNNSFKYLKQTYGNKWKVPKNPNQFIWKDQRL